MSTNNSIAVNLRRVNFVEDIYRQFLLVASVLAIAYVTAWYVPVILVAIHYGLFRLQMHYARQLAAEVSKAIGALVKGLGDYNEYHRAHAEDDVC